MAVESGRSGIYSAEPLGREIELTRRARNGPEIHVPTPASGGAGTGGRTGGPREREALLPVASCGYIHCTLAQPSAQRRTSFTARRPQATAQKEKLAPPHRGPPVHAKPSKVGKLSGRSWTSTTSPRHACCRTGAGGAQHAPQEKPPSTTRFLLPWNVGAPCFIAGAHIGMACLAGPGDVSVGAGALGRHARESQPLHSCQLTSNQPHRQPAHPGNRQPWHALFRDARNSPSFPSNSTSGAHCRLRHCPGRSRKGTS